MNNFKFSVPDLKCFTNASCQPSFAEILNHIATKHWLQTLAGTTKHRHGNFCGRIQHSVNEKCKRSLSLHFERQLFNVLLSTRFAVIFVPVVLIDYLLKWFPSMNWRKKISNLIVSVDHYQQTFPTSENEILTLISFCAILKKQVFHCCASQVKKKFVEI